MNQHWSTLRDLTGTTERQLVVRRLRVAFTELSGELKGPPGVRWAIGAPFTRLDRARTLLDGFVHVFHSAERAELERVFREYTRAFDAVAARSRQCRPDAADGQPAPPITELVEAAESAAASLCETLSAET
jgi:hypothetical protein